MAIMAMLQHPNKFRHSLAVEDAALLVLEAMEGVYRAKPLPNVLSRRCHHLAVNLKPLSRVAVVGLIVLTFFEYPTWCHADPNHSCEKTDEHGREVMTFVPLGYGQLIEAVLLVPLVVHSIVNAVAYRVKLTKFVLLDVALCVYAVDFFVAVLHHHPGIIRVAPYMRALLLIGYSSDLMAQINLLGRILAEFASILSVIAMFLGFVAWFGVVTFAGEERCDYFPNFVDACWNLLVMLTTANFPDVMIPAFVVHRAAGLLFFPVVVFGVFVLMNFLLASTYDKYSNGHKELLERMLHLREQNCVQAFDMLTRQGESEVVPEVMEELLAEVNVCCGAGPSELDRLREDQRTLLFQLMDNNNSNGVSKDEFKAVITLLQLRFEKVSPVTFMEAWFPGVFFSDFWQRLCKVVRHPWFEYAVDLILTFNSVVLIMASAEALAGLDDASDGKLKEGQEHRHPWLETGGEAQGLNSWLGWVYMLEMTLKIVVLGWKGYWSKNRNLFDGVVTIGGLVTELLVKTPKLSNAFHSTKSLMVYFVTFRMLRVARLMVAVPQMRVIITTFSNIAPEASQFMLLLFVCMFTFCVLGVQLYGGLVSSDPESAAYKKIADTAYMQDEYWPLNFNDMASGMGVLFCLLVVNNWFVFVDAFVKACDGNKWHRWFFVMFYLFGVLVILNVVIAVVLENFIIQWTARRQKRHEKRHFLEDHAHDLHDENEGPVRTGTRPNGVQYKVRLASSVKMIEKDEVIRRFLNLYENKKEAVSRQDALAKTMRRLMHVVLATTGSASAGSSSARDVPPTVEEVVVEDPALRRRNGIDESTLLLTTNHNV